MTGDDPTKYKRIAVSLRRQVQVGSIAVDKPVSIAGWSQKHSGRGRRAARR
jgi:hypothetical protein